MCKRSNAFLSGFQKTETQVRYYEKYRLPCKSFTCPECAPKKTKVVKARIFKGRINDPAIRKNKFSAKFFTLTCPGVAFRQMNTPVQALKKMQDSFNKLMTVIRLHYGKVDFFKVTEKHKDGFPHFHVLFVGPQITGKGFYRHIENVWRSNYQMGFVWVKTVYNVEHGVNYMCKYLTKSLEPIKQYQRLFSASRGALAPSIKSQSTWVEFRNVLFQYAGVRDSGKIFSLDIEVIDKVGILELIGKTKTYEDLQELITIFVDHGEEQLIKQQEV